MPATISSTSERPVLGEAVGSIVTDGDRLERNA
jgi:hypothetical protein